MRIWLVAGVAIGVAVGTLFDQVLVGMALGTAFGLVMENAAAKAPPQ